MFRKKLLWQLYPTYLIITLAALLAGGWFAFDSLKRFYYDRTAADLKARAVLVEHQVREIFSPQNAGRLDALSKELGRGASMRITLIGPEGTVLGESNEDPMRMDNHANRQEVREALAGHMGTSIRFSTTTGENQMYLAAPVMSGDKVIGVVRTSVSVAFIDRALLTVQEKIAVGVLIIVLLVAGISWLVVRRISRPLAAMKQGAAKFAGGDLSGMIPVNDSTELGGLAEALNQMARDLDDRIRTVTTQRNEREAIFSSMIEGVLAVDADEKLISLNHAAARLFQIDPEICRNRRLEEVVRNLQLLQLVQEVLSTGEPAEGDVLLREEEERFLQVRGTLLKDEADRNAGVLVVLNDVTRLRRLENVRRDFVANVSHELKTPITSIKGFIETLLNGAMENPLDTRRFLEIAFKQVNRLNAIVEDLLSLSRIEQESETAQISLEESTLKPVLQTAIQDCGIKSEEKSMAIDLDCDEGLTGRFNPPLIEQAMVNLIDNAIKYSEPGSRILVRAEKRPGEIILRVRDWGCGIPREHLPRLFERFYRVDKARSCKLGGTGLGLAIVKHIAQAHKGKVSVDSAPGGGSEFSIHLPMQN